MHSYAEIRITLAKIFKGNYRCYGYRRLHAMLRKNNTYISEKVVRRLMAEEQLIVKRAGRRRYSAYCGEIGQAPENLLARNFRSCRPNEKWLTDITEFQLQAGKVYLSPVIDCFDGKVVSWTTGTRPDAKLVNAMLDDAIDTLREHERPVIHSDRGSHYRWPRWLDRINASGLIRSMSRKGSRRIMRRVKASSGGSKMKCTMAETGRAQRWKILCASWTGTYTGITRVGSKYH